MRLCERFSGFCFSCPACGSAIKFVSSSLSVSSSVSMTTSSRLLRSSSALISDSSFVISSILPLCSNGFFSSSSATARLERNCSSFAAKRIRFSGKSFKKLSSLVIRPSSLSAISMTYSPLPVSVTLREVNASGAFRLIFKPPYSATATP